MELNERDFLKIFTGIISEGVSYFHNGSIVHLTVNDGGEDVEIKTEGIFKNKPNMECAIFKLIHNVAMLSNFHEQVLDQINDIADYINRDLKKNNTYYLEMHITNEDIKIVSRRGFGLMFYNETDMCKTIGCYSTGYVNMLKDFINQLKRNGDTSTLMYIERAYRFIEQGKHKSEINQALYDFINDNIDIYKKYL